jgi:hypothetical protein
LRRRAARGTKRHDDKRRGLATKGSHRHGSGQIELSELNAQLRRGGEVELDAALQVGAAGEIVRGARNKHARAEPAAAAEATAPPQASASAAASAPPAEPSPASAPSVSAPSASAPSTAAPAPAPAQPKLARQAKPSATKPAGAARAGLARPSSAPVLPQRRAPVPAAPRTRPALTVPSATDRDLRDAFEPGMIGKVESHLAQMHTARQATWQTTHVGGAGYVRTYSSGRAQTAADGFRRLEARLMRMQIEAYRATVRPDWHR